MNEEGRGLFDEINDISKKIFKFIKQQVRLFSLLISFKSNEKYRYFLNLESNNINIELLDIKNEEIDSSNLLELLEKSASPFYYGYSKNSLTWIQMLKYNEKN